MPRINSPAFDAEMDRGEAITLAEAAAKTACRRKDGKGQRKRATSSKIARWIKTGYRKGLFFLEARREPAGWVTTPGALKRFQEKVEAFHEGAPLTTSADQRNANALDVLADRELEKAGM